MTVDLLIKNAYVLSMDEKKSVFASGAIAIKGNSIVAVGESAEVARRHPAETVIDAAGMAAVPGLINTHLHICYSMLKGVASDITERLAWLCAVYPYVDLAGPEDCYNVAMLGCLEMIKGGTTCFIENNPFITDIKNTDSIGAAVEKSGMRVALGRMFSDINAPAFLLNNEEQMRQEFQRLYSTWHGRAGGRIQVWIYAPGPGMRESPKRMGELLKLARECGTHISSHWAETGDTGKGNYYVDKYNVRNPTQFLLDSGYLGPNTLLVHVVTVEDEEISIIARTGTMVSHNPTSNSMIPRQPMEIAPVAAMLKAGVVVGLGTDASICNDRSSMFEAMKDAVILQKVKVGDARALTAEDALRMATVNGAKVLGLENELGSLEPGKKADIILLDMNKPHIQPIHNIFENIVYCAQDSDVDTVVINGKVVMRGRVVKTFDEDEVLDRAIATTRALDVKARDRAGDVAKMWQETYKDRYKTGK